MWFRNSSLFFPYNGAAGNINNIGMVLEIHYLLSAFNLATTIVFLQKFCHLTI